MGNRENLINTRISEHNENAQLYKTVYGDRDGYNLWNQRRDVLLTQLDVEKTIQTRAAATYLYSR